MDVFQSNFENVAGAAKSQDMFNSAKAWNTKLLLQHDKVAAALPAILTSSTRSTTPFATTPAPEQSLYAPVAFKGGASEDDSDEESLDAKVAAAPAMADPVSFYDPALKKPTQMKQIHLDELSDGEDYDENADDSKGGRVATCWECSRR